MDAVNQRIKELRQNLNLSQEDFGKAIGLSKSGISNIENGTRAVRLTHIKLICSEFGVSEEWLCEGLSNEIKELETFVSFLKSMAYLVKIQPISDDECEITVKKNGIATVYSQSDFQAFQAEIRRAVDYQVWQQNSRSSRQ